MNVIIKKSNKEVLFYNTDSKNLSPTETWHNFDSETMQKIYCPGYVPKIGEAFKPTISGDTILQFEKKTVWNTKILAPPRQLLDWDDEIRENETFKEPKFDIVEGRKVYKQFQDFKRNRWIVDTDAEYEASIPQQLTPAQAKLALDAIGKFDTVENLMQNSNTSNVTKIMWYNATSFDINNPILLSLAKTIGLNKNQIDQLFIAGARLNV